MSSLVFKGMLNTFYLDGGSHGLIRCFNLFCRDQRSGSMFQARKVVIAVATTKVAITVIGKTVKTPSNVGFIGNLGIRKWISRQRFRPKRTPKSPPVTHKVNDSTTS